MVSEALTKLIEYVQAENLEKYFGGLLHDELQR